MHWFVDLITNPFLLTSISGWAVAQVLKVIINAVVYKKFDLSRLFGDGGMPSGHSATVSSLACITGLVYGPSSFEFAFTAILAIIVCHDAMGVRMETGKQAIILNEIMDGLDIIFSDEVAEVKLKEMVGHTMPQVIAGVILGILDAIIVYNIFFI
jgi:acid phosphatase family membrane protein YuiD